VERGVPPLNRLPGTVQPRRSVVETGQAAKALFASLIFELTNRLSVPLVPCIDLQANVFGVVL
jgi:hypothetical protein